MKPTPKGQLVARHLKTFPDTQPKRASAQTVLVDERHPRTAEPHVRFEVGWTESTTAVTWTTRARSKYSWIWEHVL